MRQTIFSSMPKAGLGTFLFVAVGIALASCQDPYSYDYYKRFFLQPYGKTETEVMEVRKIVREEAGPPKKIAIVGYLERNRTRVEGTRSEYEFYFIYDDTFKRVGYVKENGEFFRYTPEMELQSIGVYPIDGIGPKMFFNLPLSAKVYLESVTE